MNVILQRYDGLLMAVDTGATPGATYWASVSNPDPNWVPVAYDQTVPYGDASTCDWNGISLAVNVYKFLQVMAPRAVDVLNGQLQATALAWGYDSKESLATYANSTITRFKNDATAFIAWRDSIWNKIETDEALLISGSIPLPASLEEYLATFPAPPAKP